MINEISQHMAGEPSPRKGRVSDNISPVKAGAALVKGGAAVGASKATMAQPQKNVETVSSVSQVPVDDKDIESLKDELNEFAQSVQRQLEFTVDKDSGKTIVRVIDVETGETVRDIPPEEIRNMQKHLKEVSDQIFNKGSSSVALLFNGKA